MRENVVVYPITSDHKRLMLKAYRHGVGKVTHHLPGGFINGGETPLDAGNR
jgi:ADP-ribose pyrophosphatase YjhB (NUDIX family)|tara:strand:+ start:325 stop:477 length:153 start_codon:yes stop_codon:yes gene_type:complete